MVKITKLERILLILCELFKVPCSVLIFLLLVQGISQVKFPGIGFVILFKRPPVKDFRLIELIPVVFFIPLPYVFPLSLPENSG
jgi:hypothetical protein